MTQETLTLRATRLGSSRRRPRTTDGHRVCSSPECDTVLSRYNSSDTCHSHRPITFPRVRGAVAES
ncbi:MAG TPA: hypothetical protein VHL52_12105 [Acidimicrobiia bacterium]|nr:hypothetical protein [Acidimicrobiia bacterium]